MFELSLEDGEHILDGLLLEVGALDELVITEVEDRLGGVATDALEDIDDPRLDLVREVLKADILLSLRLLAEDVDIVASELDGELDVATALTDGHGNLLGVEVDLSLAAIVIDNDAVDLGWAESSLYVELDIIGVVDDVDVLVLQLTDNGVDARTLHADASSYGVDAVVIRLDSHLGALAWHADNLADGDEAVEDLRDLILKHPLKEHGRGARDDDKRVVVLELDTSHDSLDLVALAEEVGRDLLRLGEDEVIALLVAYENLALPRLIDLAGHDLTDALLVTVEKVVLLKVHHKACKVLLEAQDGTAAEVLELDLVGDLLADLEILLDLLGLREADLEVRVIELIVLDDGAATEDLEVAFLGVDDDVEVRVGAELLDENAAEGLLEDSHHSGPVNILQVLELGKSINQRVIFHYNFFSKAGILYVFVNDQPTHTLARRPS